MIFYHFENDPEARVTYLKYDMSAPPNRSTKKRKLDAITFSSPTYKPSPLSNLAATSASPSAAGSPAPVGSGPVVEIDVYRGLPNVFKVSVQFMVDLEMV